MAYRHPDFDYLSYALRMRREIQAQRDLISEEIANARKLRSRIEKGRRWLCEQTESHPRYEHNRELLRRLEWCLDCELWSLRDSRVRLMDLQIAFWSAYDTLSPIEQQGVDATGIARIDPAVYEHAMTNWNRKDV